MATPYRVLRTCFHNGSRYREGQVATFPDGEAVPYHFKPLNEAKADEAEPESEDEISGEEEAKADEADTEKSSEKGRK